jgi:hypothetical protein
VIPTYSSTYVYIGGGVCAIFGGVVLCGPGYVRRGFFHPLAFQFLVDGLGGLPTCNLFLLLLCVLFYFPKYKVGRLLSGVCTDLR